MTIHPDPWRSDHLHAAVYVPAEPFPTWHVVIAVAAFIVVWVIAFVYWIGGPRCPDCSGACPVCDAAWRRERRGL